MEESEEYRVSSLITREGSVVKEIIRMRETSYPRREAAVTNQRKVGRRRTNGVKTAKNGNKFSERKSLSKQSSDDRKTSKPSSRGIKIGDAQAKKD